MDTATLYIVEQRLHEVRKNLDISWDRMSDALDNVSNVSVKKDFDPLIQAIEHCVIPLKRSRNAVLPIHRLPDELLSFIVRLAGPPVLLWKTSVNTHLSYTWVCHRWRWVLTHDPVLWSYMAFGDDSPNRQRLRRELYYLSKSAELSILVKPISNESKFLQILQDTFVTEGHRIRNLYLPFASSIVKWLSCSSITLPSLRTLQLGLPGHFPPTDFFDLLPILEASNNLQNLCCPIWDRPNAPFHRLASIFSRIRRLDIQVHSQSTEFNQSLFASLRACVKLQTLTIDCDDNLKGQVMVLPELQMLDIPYPNLTNYIRAPKLSHLDCKSTGGLLDISRLELNIFDFALIRYLYIKIDTKQRDCCISGSGSKESKGYQCPEWVHPEYDEDVGVFSTGLHRNYFHFQVKSYWSQSPLSKLLQPSQPLESLLPLLSRILPRLTNLTELHLLVPHGITELEDIMNVIKHAPLNPIDKLLVNKLVI